MRRKLYSVLAAIGITLAVSFGLSAPALAAYSGSYSGTMAYGNTKFATQVERSFGERLMGLRHTQFGAPGVSTSVSTEPFSY